MSEDQIPWHNILEELDPRSVHDPSLPRVESFRTLPDPEHPPVWKGDFRPSFFDLRQLQIANRGRDVQNAVFLSGYVDASYHHDTKRAGWGCWLRDAHTRILRNGPSPRWVSSANDAELTALFAGIWTAVSSLDTTQANILVLKTDSQHAARLFGWDGGTKKEPKRIQVLDLIFRGFDLAERAGLKLIVKWVKGHQGTAYTQAYLNTQADRLAKEAMRTQRGRQRVVDLNQVTPAADEGSGDTEEHQ